MGHFFPFQTIHPHFGISFPPPLHPQAMREAAHPNHHPPATDLGLNLNICASRPLGSEPDANWVINQVWRPPWRQTPPPLSPRGPHDTSPRTSCCSKCVCRGGGWGEQAQLADILGLFPLPSCSAFKAKLQEETCTRRSRWHTLASLAEGYKICPPTMLFRLSRQHFAT